MPAVINSANANDYMSCYKTAGLLPRPSAGPTLTRRFDAGANMIRWEPSSMVTKDATVPAAFRLNVDAEVAVRS